MTTKNSETLAERIAARESKIADLNHRWHPYRHVQPLMPSAVPAGGFDPTRLREKLRIAVEIDRENVLLEEDKAGEARARLAALDVADDLAALERDRDGTEVEMDVARRAARTAEATYRSAAAALAAHRERIKVAEAALAGAEARRERWAREADREGRQLTDLDHLAKVREMAGVAR